MSSSGSSSGTRGVAERTSPTVGIACWAQVQADNMAEDFILRVMSNIRREVSEEESESSLPGDLQDPIDLQSQAEFWASILAAGR